MTYDLMLDTETLSTRPNAVFTNLGAIKFDPFGDDSNSILGDKINMNTFYRRIDPGSFDWPTAHIDPNTIEWWSKQAPEALEEVIALDDRHDVRDVLKDFYKWAGKPRRVWANGAAFDSVIIETACRELERAYPWEYWQFRDSRTIMKMVDVERTKMNYHHALWDCWCQVVDLQRALKVLNLTSFAEDKPK
jgi:hypothetical protein